MAKKSSNGKSLVTLELLTEFYVEMIKPNLTRIEEKVDRNSKQILENSRDINDLKVDVQELRVKVDHLDDTLDGIKADLSDTVSRKEFKSLKRKVYS